MKHCTIVVHPGTPQSGAARYSDVVEVLIDGALEPRLLVGSRYRSSHGYERATHHVTVQNHLGWWGFVVEEESPFDALAAALQGGG